MPGSEKNNLTEPLTDEKKPHWMDRFASDKRGFVGQVFSSVADHYDLMNDLMSGGLHRLWKRSLIDSLRPSPGLNYLDLAGGTGDIAFLIQRAIERSSKKIEDHSPTITVCDINSDMLAVGEERAVDRGLLNKISWIEGDAENLPFDDACFDTCTIAFGIRNVNNMEKALSEIYRVLKPGGHFLCLEFSRLATGFLGRAYDIYSTKIIPALGSAIAGDQESYEYLVESIKHFPNQSRFTRMIENTGFSRVSYRNLTQGVVAIHSGWRI